MEINERALVEAAFQAREKAYAPYSHFKVGAALLTAEGKVYLGCNIENAAYPVAVCAERTALFKAVSEGERRFAALAVVGGLEGERETPLCAPCGVCRQALAEFCSPEMPVIMAVTPEERTVMTLGQLLPASFGPQNLQTN